MSATRNLVRASRSTAFSPSSISGLVGWWDSDAIGLADGTLIASWPDAAATAHNLSTSGATRPTYMAGILNGHGVARFLGGQNMTSAVFTVAQPDTTFVVGSVTATAAQQRFVDSVSTNAHALYMASAAYGIYAAGGFTGEVADTAAHVLTFTTNGASSKIRKDGAAGTAGTAGAGTYGGVSLGHNGYPLTGDIAAVLIWNRVLTLTEINQVGPYLATRYGLTWTTAT